MEGILHLYKGYFSGFGAYYAFVEVDRADFVLRKNSHKGTEKLRLHLDSGRSTSACRIDTKVYALDSQLDTELLLVDEVSRSQYRLRAESPFKRVQWLQAINSFTRNLAEDLRIVR